MDEKMHVARSDGVIVFSRRPAKNLRLHPGRARARIATDWAGRTSSAVSGRSSLRLRLVNNTTDGRTDGRPAAWLTG